MKGNDRVISNSNGLRIYSGDKKIYLGNFSEGLAVVGIKRRKRLGI